MIPALCCTWFKSSRRDTFKNDVFTPIVYHCVHCCCVHGLLYNNFHHQFFLKKKFIFLKYLILLMCYTIRCAPSRIVLWTLWVPTRKWQHGSIPTDGRIAIRVPQPWQQRIQSDCVHSHWGEIGSGTHNTVVEPFNSLHTIDYKSKASTQNIIIKQMLSVLLDITE